MNGTCARAQGRPLGFLLCCMRRPPRRKRRPGLDQRARDAWGASGALTRTPRRARRSACARPKKGHPMVRRVMDNLLVGKGEVVFCKRGAVVSKREAVMVKRAASTNSQPAAAISWPTQPWRGCSPVRYAGVLCQWPRASWPSTSPAAGTRSCFAAEARLPRPGFRDSDATGWTWSPTTHNTVHSQTRTNSRRNVCWFETCVGGGRGGRDTLHDSTTISNEPRLRQGEDAAGCTWIGRGRSSFGRREASAAHAPVRRHARARARLNNRGHIKHAPRNQAGLRQTDRSGRRLCQTIHPRCAAPRRRRLACRGAGWRVGAGCRRRLATGGARGGIGGPSSLAGGRTRRAGPP
jgi:hypothetical protein